VILIKNKNKDKVIPVFSIDLIEELDEIYPVITPEPKMSKDQIMYKAGQRSVIDRLMILKEEAQKEGLEGSG
jgi:myosin-crossreactive antigen